MTKTFPLLTAFALLCVLLSLPGCSSEQPIPEADREYHDTINAQRRAKDALFGNPRTSPLPPEQVSHFSGLKYFPVDRSFVVQARLEPVSDPQPILIPTSKGTFRDYLKSGRLLFTVADRECSLAAYQPKDGNNHIRLFVPFTDKTTGRETYGAGRYLEIHSPSGTSSVTIDFNLAYNPYCAYNYKYSCPFPPEENDLPVRIVAGEKDFPHE